MKDKESTYRKEMVREQIVRRGVKDPEVLRAMESVPRHLFVPESFQSEAYSDYPLPIGEGQTISQPYIVAWMTELLHVSKGDKVLEVGTGSGYQAAVLAEMGVEVYTIEILPNLAKRADELLTSLNYSNVHVLVGDGSAGTLTPHPTTESSSRLPLPLSRILSLNSLKLGSAWFFPSVNTYRS